MEIKKKIGVKYCGGCNPTYERVEMIHQVQSSLGDRFHFLSFEQQGLNGLLLINGCPRSCAINHFDHQETAYFSISGEHDFGLLMDWLTALDK
jgi:hypothetical protein